MKFLRQWSTQRWLIALGGVLAAFGLWLYLNYAAKHPSTDDAYVKAHILHIAPQVSGEILQVYVHNHEQVKQGQLLFEIDPKPFQIAVKNAQAKLVFAQQDNQRYGMLANKGLVAERYNNYQRAAASMKEAQSALAKAKLNLQYTKVYAPCDGTIAQFDLQPGDVANALQPVFALVDNHSWWVDANFKEKIVGEVRVGQPALIRLDMYPNKVFKGKVVGIAAGSGDSFSIMPPENASGNWVKVTQRFPVKVKIENTDSHHPLRIGASATVKVQL